MEGFGDKDEVSTAEPCMATFDNILPPGDTDKLFYRSKQEFGGYRLTS